jgi:hypothetical protein
MTKFKIETCTDGASFCPVHGFKCPAPRLAFPASGGSPAREERDAVLPDDRFVCDECGELRSSTKRRANGHDVCDTCQAPQYRSDKTCSVCCRADVVAGPRMKTNRFGETVCAECAAGPR